jgi:hypothetical protein
MRAQLGNEIIEQKLHEREQRDLNSTSIVSLYKHCVILLDKDKFVINMTRLPEMLVW